jgi:hypothetical protein
MHSLAFAIISLIIGAFIGSWFRTTQQRTDHELARFDNMVDEVIKLQSLTQTYWVKQRREGDSPEEHEKLEAEIKGRFLLINIYFSSFDNKLTHNEIENIKQSVDEFFENATGGSFGDSIRSVDLSRVQRVYRTGGLLINKIRDTKAEKLISAPEKFIRKTPRSFIKMSILTKNQIKKIFDRGKTGRTKSD